MPLTNAAVSALRRAPEGISEASAAPLLRPSSRSTSAISGSRAPAIKTPKQSAMPVRAIAQPSAGIWRKLRSATKRPRSWVRELMGGSDEEREHNGGSEAWRQDIVRLAATVD